MFKLYNLKTVKSVAVIVLSAGLVLPLGALADNSKDKNKDKKEKNLIPAGMLVAPGLRVGSESSAKVNSRVTATVMVGDQSFLIRLPFGVAKKLGLDVNKDNQDKDEKREERDRDRDDDRDNDREEDKVAPRISDLRIGERTSSSAVVSWRTNEPANGKVYLSAASGIALGTALPVASSSELTLVHRFSLAGLSADTRYFVRVSSADKSGNERVSGEHSFTTKATISADTKAPAIVGATVWDIGETSARVAWFTDELANAKVYLSTSFPVAAVSTNLIASADAKTYFHSFNLSGLRAGSTYYLTISSADVAGNVGVSSVLSFSTPSVVVDVTAPGIVGTVAVDISSSSARIIWATTERGWGKLYLSTSSPVAIDVAHEVAASADITFLHSLSAGSLATSTTYFYAVASADAAGNVERSSEGSFTTRSQ